MNVVIADDHALFRQGLTMLLESHRDITVVGAADSGQEVVSLAVDLWPDAAVVDVDMPGWTLDRTLDALRRHHPAMHVVVVTPEECGLIPSGLRRRGVEHLVSKVDPVHHLVRALRASCGSVTTPCALSAREMQVLQAIAAAMTNQQIASALQIRPATVKRHISNIFAKLGAVSRLDAVNLGRHQGAL